MNMHQIQLDIGCKFQLIIIMNIQHCIFMQQHLLNKHLYLLHMKHMLMIGINKNQFYKMLLLKLMHMIKHLHQNMHHMLLLLYRIHFMYMCHYMLFLMNHMLYNYPINNHNQLGMKIMLDHSYMFIIIHLFKVNQMYKEDMIHMFHFH